MKKLLFATLCSAMFFGACSNEDSPIAEGPQLADNQFLLKLNAGDLNLVQSRAAADGTEADFKVTDVFLYNATGAKIGGWTFGENIFGGLTGPSVATLTVPLSEGSTSTDVHSVVVLSNILSTKANAYPFKMDVLPETASYTELMGASLRVNDTTDSPAWEKDDNQIDLPFAGSVTAVTEGSATVKLERKVARIDFVNTSTASIGIAATGLVSEYKSFIKPYSQLTLPSTPANSNLSLTRDFLIGNKTLSLYVLPTNNVINFTATVPDANATFSLDSIVANKKYVYTLSYTPTNSISVDLSVQKDWNDGVGGQIALGLPTQTNERLPMGPEATEVILAHASVADIASLIVNSDDFSVSFKAATATTRAGEGKVVATVVPKRYAEKTLTTSLIIEREETDGTRTSIQTLPVTQEAFPFEKVIMGTHIFMDRDLGATAPNRHGEVYTPGFGFIDQEDAHSVYKTDFIGGGRIPATTSVTVDRGYFDAFEPCPKGWHTMNLDDASLLFDYGTGLRPDNGQANGNHDITTGSQIGILNLTPSIEDGGKTLKLLGSTGTLKFNLEHGHFSGSWYNPINPFASGWWVNHVADTDRYVSVVYSSAQKRIQCRPNDINRFGQPRAFSIRCVKNEKVTTPN